jgi:GTP-binding protein YchF
MSLSIGIVGLPNVGKSTLFNALTKKGVPAENYPFCTIDPSVGIVPVPDDRLSQLNAFSNSTKIIPAVVEFVDIAGLVKGASEGEGLGNQFLQHIREVDAIAEVVRTFIDPNVVHVNGHIDPMSDVETINLELILADLQTVTKRLQNVARDAKRGEKEAVAEEAVLKKIEAALLVGKLASSVTLDDKEEIYRRNVHLLSAKPILYILNQKAGAEKADLTRLMKFLEESGSPYVYADAKIEMELSELTPEDKAVFKEELKVDNDGLNDLIVASYKLLGLMTYFTTGDIETRAWTIKLNSTAPVAGMAIHTDFKDKFIRAEVVNWADLIKAGSYGKARELGLIRTEGKEYIVKDGDTIEFKI